MTLFVTVGKNDNSADFNTADYASDDAAIQAAIGFAAANGHAEVRLGAGEFSGLVSSVLLTPNVTLRGAGEAQTVLKGSRDSAEAINSSTTGWLVNSGLADLTIDVDYTHRASGFKVHNFENFTVSNVTVKHIDDNGWGAFFGVENAPTNDTRNDGLVLDNLTVDQHRTSTLESVLIFNTDNVSGNTHISNRTNGPSVGLWQKTKNVTLDVTGENVTGSGSYLFYYSYSIEDLDIRATGTNIKLSVIRVFGPVERV